MSLLWRLATAFRLKAENAALTDRIAELEKVVAQQGDQLKALLDLVPRVLGRRPAISAEMSHAGSDRPETLH